MKAIPLPKKTTTPSLPIPAEAAPIKALKKEQKEQVREAESAKRTGKAEASKENKKANEKDKVSKKKESASNEKGRNFRDCVCCLQISLIPTCF